MADTKISELTDAGDIASGDTVPVVRAGSTQRANVPIDTPGSLLTTGNYAATGGTVAQVDQAEVVTAQWSFESNTRGSILFNRAGNTRTFALSQETDGRAAVRDIDNARDLIRFALDGGVHSEGVTSQGDRTLNFTALYEQGNRVQTDYVFDAYLDDQIDYDHYDALMGTRWVESETETEPVEEEEEVTEECDDYKEEWDERQQAYVRRKCTKRKPVYDEHPVLDEDGKQIGVKRVKRTRTVTKHVPKQIEVPQEHAPAKRFEFNDLDIDTFCGKFCESRKLPAMERCEKNLREGQQRPSMGQITQALTETAEVEAVHIMKLKEMIDAQAEQIESLTERLKKLEG